MRLKAAGFRLIVATNQPDVGRGTMDASVVEDIHNAMAEQLPLDRIEVCYDSSDQQASGFEPAPGMLIGAANELGIRLSQLHMVGDAVA